MKETLAQNKLMFDEYVNSMQKQRGIEDDDDIPQSEVKQHGQRQRRDGSAPPGVGNQECTCKREYESQYKSLNKQLEIMYHEVQRLVQIVKVTKATAAVGTASKLASKTNSALPSHRGVYIEVGFKGATEVINDAS